MGLPAIEENKANYCLSPKILQPPTDSMDCPLESPRKKKSFSSSSFYEEPNAIYPTIEEQVKLCRKIAESLSDDCNQRSRGANMFFKRVKKAEKWVVSQSGNDDESDCGKDPARMPYVRPSKGLPKLKLMLAPRPLVDIHSLRRDGVDIVEHNAVSPELCHNLVRDLNSNAGRGSQIFAKRKKKSEEWVVDEEKVRHLLQERYHISYPVHRSSPEPPGAKDFLAESLIRAAEAKVMTYPNAVPHVTVIQPMEGPDGLGQPTSLGSKPSPWASEAYKCRLPKGWTSVSSTATTLSARPVSQDISSLVGTLFVPESHHSLQKSSSSSSLRRTFSFSNFNASPRAWNADVPVHFRPAAIKSVKPPSVLVQ